MGKRIGKGYRYRSDQIMEFQGDSRPLRVAGHGPENLKDREMNVARGL